MQGWIRAFAFLILASLGIGTAQAGTPSCASEGSSSSTAIAGCIPAIYQWGSAVNPESSLVYATPEAALARYFAWVQEVNPGFCQYGCDFATQDEPGSLKSKSGTVTRYAQDGSVKSISYPGTHAAGVCPPNYGAHSDFNAAGDAILNCIPNSAIKDKIDRTQRADATNTCGACLGQNPVSLDDLHKVDWEVDYQNASPYPIVWGRTYNGRLRTWIFNYNRHLQAARVVGSSIQARVVLTRQDGQVLTFQGTFNGTDWTWVPALSSAGKSALILLKVTSDANLTAFTVRTHQDELETYDAQGRLTQMEDLRHLPLTFTYDATNRLTRIDDASGRFLNLTYGGTVQHATAPDKNGHTQTYDYTQFDEDGGLDANLLAPDTVSDGTRSVGYVAIVNPADSLDHPILSQVIKPDGTVRTYNYDSASQYAGLTDENGDRYSTYTTSSSTNQVSQTYHGDHQETITYGSTKVTFPNGQSMTYTREGTSQKMTSQTQSCSWCTGAQYKAISYDTFGNPTSLTDFNSHVETRIYDTARGVPTSITEGSGTAQARTRTYTWDPRFLKPTTVTRPVRTPNGVGSQVATYTYDDTGNLTAWSLAVTGPGSYSATRSGSATYNTFGEHLSVTNARGKTITMAYDAQGNRTSVTDALGHTTTFGGYDTAGNVGWSLDANGLRTEFTYDPLQRLTQVRRGCEPGSAADCHWETSTIVYNPMGAIASVTGPDGRGLAYHYDTAHRRTAVDVTSQGAVLGTTTLSLNANSELTGLMFKDANGLVLRTQGFTYDGLSRLTAVVDSHAKAFAQTWDAQSNLATTTDPLNHGTVNTYDALDRLIQTKLPDLNLESQTYGADDTVLTQTDGANHTTTTTYNGFGEPVSRTSPDSGLTTWTRDAQGNALTQTDARGRVLTTTYDDLDRPLTQAGSTAPLAEAITWTYDTCVNGIGRLCAMTDRSGTTTFAYDRWGRLTQRSQVLGGHPYTQAYAYNAQGQRVTLTYPSGASLTQTWADGRVVSQQWNGQPILSAAQYDPWDKALGWTWASGRTFSIGWDLDGRVSTIAAGAGASSQTYTYDDAWRLTGVSHNGAAETYGYDIRNRLTSGTTWGAYTYDANSNRLSWLGGLGPMSYGIQSGSNRLAAINGMAVTTDAAGNLTSTPDLTLTYDDWSRLRSATAGGVTTTYTVNGLGERVGKAQGATQRVFYIYSAPGHLLGVYDGTTGLPLEEWAYLGERPVADARGSQVYAIETDHLMAPLRVLDPSNATVWSWENREPFGASDPVEGTVGGQPFQMGLRFPGQYADTETGLVSNGFRDYNSVVGGYVETDPTGLAAGFNLYGYVKASPLDKFDIFGLDEIAVNFYGSGARHVGISVNGSQSRGYYPVKGGGYDLLYAIGYSAPGYMRYDSIEQGGRAPSDVVRIEVSPDQAEKAVMEIEKMEKNPGDYNLYTNDCAHHVERVLNAAGVRGVPDTMWPNNLFDSLISKQGNVK